MDSEYIKRNAIEAEVAGRQARQFLWGALVTVVVIGCAVAFRFTMRWLAGVWG